MMERYGDYFSGSEFELDEALLKASMVQPQGPVPARSRSRKSAGPAVLATPAPPAAAPAPQPVLPPSQHTSLTRQRRRTLAPGQVGSSSLYRLQMISSVGSCNPYVQSL